MNDPDGKPAADSLHAEIAALRAAVAQAKDELYQLNMEYASQHFGLQSSLQAKGIERLRRVGVESSSAVLQQRCAALERSVAELRAALAAVGIDADESR